MEFLKTKKADQQYEVVERITTIEDENGEIMQKTNQVYIGFPPCAHLEIEIIFTIFSANVHSTLWKFQSHLPAYPPPGDSRWSKFQYQVQIFGQKYYIRRSDRHSFTTCSYWICSRIKKISSVPNSFSFWIFSKMSDLARQCQKESGDFSDSDSIIVSSFNIYGLTDGSISTKNL